MTKKQGEIKSLGRKRTRTTEHLQKGKPYSVRDRKDSETSIQTDKSENKEIGKKIYKKLPLKTSSLKKKRSRRDSEISKASNQTSEKRNKKATRQPTNRSFKNRTDSFTDSAKEGISQKDRRGGKFNQLGIFNRNIFNDPFFNEWGHIFNVPSIEDIFSKTKEIGKQSYKSQEKFAKDLSNQYPGNFTSKSYYRTYSSAPGQEPKKEVISQESIVNVDEKGRKFTELWKNMERDNEKKTTHTKLIDEKGIKQMTTHKLDTNEDYEHIDYRHMNEKELSNFNNEFEKGVKHIRNVMPSGSFLGSSFSSIPSLINMLPDKSRFDRDYFSEHNHDRYGLPISDRESSDIDKSSRQQVSSESSRKGQSERK